MKKLAEKIKELRASKKISQQDLAKILGYAQSVVARWELDKGEPTLEGLLKLSNYFNVSTDYLLGTADIATIRQNPNLMEVFPHERQVIKAYRVLSPSQQEMVSRMLGIAYEMSVAKEA